MYTSILNLLSDIGVLSACVRIGTLDAEGFEKECFLETLKYLKTSKQHPFETPGIGVFCGFSKVLSDF